MSVHLGYAGGLEKTTRREESARGNRRNRQMISSEGRKALVALPIRRENRMIGLLYLSSKS